MYQPLDLLLLFPTRLLLVAVAIVMMRRGLHRQYPFFFTFLVLFTVRTVVLYAVHTSELAYFFCYYVADAVAVPVYLAVIYELFTHLFEPYEAIRELSSKVFRGCLFALLGLALVATATAHVGDKYPILAGIMAVERSFAIVRVGLILTLFLFARYLGLVWKYHAFGIAVGLGVSSSASLISYTLRAHVGQAGDVFDYGVRAAAICSACIWALYIFKPEPAPQVAAVPKPDLNAWNHTLAELLSR